MTDAPVKAQPQPMLVGGTLLAIVPQSFEEIQRVANTVIAGGLAPASLLKRPRDDSERAIVAQQNIAAVAGVIMAGAEVGLPPMAALRSFTSINGRPALYADGNVAVVRKAKGSDGKPLCGFIRTGYVVGDSDESTFAWCEAKRNDNDETHREEFSIADAKQAGLWQDDAEVMAEVWEYNEVKGKRLPVWKKVQNPAPWFRFRKRMMMWRAAGWCLRWLFADVLGGMLDEYEAREIEQMVDITPTANPAIKTLTPSSILPEPEEPQPPAPDEPPLHNPDQPEGGENEAGDDFNQDDSGVAEGEGRRQGETPAAYLTRLKEALASATDEPSVEEIFDLFDVQSGFADDEITIAEAFDLKKARLDYLARLAPIDSMGRLEG